jgi:NCS2 family nucleobase:cation symporter-2
MARKPATMRYLADEVPPPAIVLVNALQFVAVIASFLVLPLIVAREAGLPPHQAEGLIGWTLLALAIGTSLQALPRGPVGSGYLAPSTLTAIFLGPSLHAIQLGGLALMAGMTVFAGLVQVAFASGLNRLRRLLPAELAGVIVLMVGVSNGIIGLRTLLRPDAGALPAAPEWIVAGVTLGVMVAANVWSRGLLGMACALVGMVAGYAAALALGVLPLARLAELAALPLLAPPAVAQIGWSFDPTLMLAFAVAGLANGLKAAGLLTATQRAQDADWVRPDLGPISRGVRADGLTVALSGGLAVFATNISASSVGLIAATGVASRRVAYATSACFAVLAFCPMVSRLLMQMPEPVLGATLIFTSCAILKGGIEAIAVRMYDTRKTLVVGLSIIAGLGVEAFPRAFALVPEALRPLTVSSLVFGTTVGFLLNLVFRIGQTRREVLRIDPAQPDIEAAARFVEARGAQWGARRDVVLRAEWAVQELVGTIAEGFAERGPLRLSASFDEFNLRLTLRYAGRPFPLVRERPSADEIAADPEGAHRLAAWLLGRRTNRITSQSDRSGEQVVRLSFDH